MNGVLSWLVRWAHRAGIRDFCSALNALANPKQNYFFFLAVHYLNFFVPIAQQAGQAAVLCRLSLSVCLIITYCKLHKYMSRIFMSFMNYIDISEL